MCIKIVKKSEEISYDVNTPLEEQLVGSKQVLINYEPHDPSIDKFLDEVERLCKNGVTAKLNIKFNHNNNLQGVRLRNEINKIAKNLDLNEVIKIMANMQAEADKKLEEMANYCMDGNCRVK